MEHWVSRIAINTCLNQVKAEKIRPELRLADLSEAEAKVVENLASTSDDLTLSEQGAAKELVNQLLACLKPQDRLILNLLHIEERTIEEIKAITGWNIPLVKVRAFRARQKFKSVYTKLTGKGIL
jgi:RNA polymerase sigma-70 factor (ECF subfamily)